MAAAWLALFWRDPRTGVLPAIGALLAPIGLLALLPLAAQPAAGLWRKACVAGAGVLVAAAVAGLRGATLPVSDTLVGDLGVAGSERPLDVATAVTSTIGSSAGVLAVALVLALVAAAVPVARLHGLWGVAVLCSCQLTGLLLLAPGTSWQWVVAGTWILGAALLLPPVATLRLTAESGR